MLAHIIGWSAIELQDWVNSRSTVAPSPAVEAANV